MKVTITTGIYPPDIGGPAKFIPQFATYLNNKNYSVEVITLEDRKGIGDKSNIYKVKFLSRKSSIIVRKIKTILSLLVSLKSHDILFANGLYEESSIALKLTSKKGIAKIVGDPIWERFSNKNQIESFETFNLEEKSLKWKFQNLLLLNSLKKFSHVYYPSQQLMDTFKKRGLKVNQSVISNGVKCHEIIESTDEFDVISISRLTKWKNLDKLIIACQRHDLSLAIAGDGPELNKLKKLSSEINARTKFLGKISQNNVSETLRKGKIFALISSYEGMSFALLEAMMSGKPILASNTQGNSQVVKNNISGIIVDPSNIDEIGFNLKKLKENTNFSKTISIQANKQAKMEYCEEKMFEKIENLIKEVSG